MIRYFNTGYLSRYLILFIAAVVLWLPQILLPDSNTEFISFAFNVIESIFQNNVYVLTILSLLATIVTAFLLNVFTIDSELSGKVGTLTLAIYILLTASQTGGFMNNPMIWVNLLMIFVWFNLMQLPKSTRAIAVVFNASFLIGIASLFYSQLIFLFLLVWVSIFVHRIVTLRTLVVTVIGAITPYFFLLTWFFYTDTLNDVSYDLFNSFWIDPNLPIPVTILNISIFIILVSLTLVSVTGIFGRLGEKNINQRRNLLVTILYLFISISIVILFKSSVHFYLLLVVPSAILISYWLSNVRLTKWYNVILSATIFLLLINNYSNLILHLIRQL